jgi:hypothetical protein
MQRMGPVATSAKVGLAPSTAHRILVSCRINRLGHVDCMRFAFVVVIEAL